MVVVLCFEMRELQEESWGGETIAGYGGAGVLTSVLLQGGLGKSSALLGEHAQAWAPGVEAW